MLTKLAFAAVLFSGVALASEPNENTSYADYVAYYRKTWSAEGEQRYNDKIAEIRAHNAAGLSWTMGVNKFTDMSEQEFESYYRGRKAPRVKGGMLGADNSCDPSALSYIALPPSIDWRSKGAVTAVKDQGSCGSCWAFSTTESIESNLFVETGSIQVLSPQDVVSCTPNPDNCGGSGGCNGAIAELGFKWVESNGIATEANWPYHATTGTCNQAQHTMVVKINGCVKLKENNYTDLMQAVVQKGPISVSVDASQWGTYSSGIYSACDKKSTLDIDHAVQLVGYGTENGQDYWIVRNSWGASWGEKGYIRLLRHSDGSSQWCKTDKSASDGSACDGDPETITVCGECGIWYDNSYPFGAHTI
jgi:cathepsin L